MLWTYRLVEVAGRPQSSEPGRDSHADQGYNLDMQEKYFKGSVRQICNGVVVALLYSLRTAILPMDPLKTWLNPTPLLT